MGETNPKTNFYIQSADTEVGAGEQRILLIGQKTSAGTASEKVLYKDIPNDNSWDVLFGKKSMLSAMIRQARSLCSIGQNQVRIDAIALNDVEAGTAPTGSISITGTATESKSLKFVIGSEYCHSFQIDVVKGQTATDVASALNTAINADATAMFSSSVNSGAVTLTFGHKGTVGNGTTIAVDGAVGGIAISLDAFADGASNPTVDADLFNLVSKLRYQGVAYPIEYGLTACKTLLDSRFNAKNKILDGCLFVCKTDTLANHKTALGALNSQNVHYQTDKAVGVSAYTGSSIPEFDFVKSTYNAVIRALRNAEGSELSNFVIGQYPTDLSGGVHNNSLPFANTKNPLANPIKPELHWTGDEIAELGEAGGSVYDNNSADNALIMGEQFTTYKTDIAGNPDVSFKYLNYRDTMSAIREYRFAQFKKDFAQHRANSTTEQQVRNAFLKYYSVLADQQHLLLRDGSEAFKFYNANLKVAVDFAKGQVTVICKDPIVTQLREINGYFKETFDLASGSVV